MFLRNVEHFPIYTELQHTHKMSYSFHSCIIIIIIITIIIIIIIIIIILVLGPLACFPSELIWNYGSYRQSVGPLGRGSVPR
jgi:hypothetical protein